MSDVRRWSDIKNSTLCSVCKWPGEMRPYLSWKCMELSEQMNDNECSMVLSCVMPCRTSKILEWFARSLARPDVRTCQLFNTATISKADLPIGDTYRDFDLLCDPWSPGHRKSLALELSAFEVTWLFDFNISKRKGHQRLVELGDEILLFGRYFCSFSRVVVPKNNSCTVFGCHVCEQPHFGLNRRGGARAVPRERWRQGRCAWIMTQKFWTFGYFGPFCLTIELFYVL